MQREAHPVACEAGVGERVPRDVELACGCVEVALGLAQESDFLARARGRDGVSRGLLRVERALQEARGLRGVAEAAIERADVRQRGRKLDGVVVALELQAAPELLERGG